MTTTQAYYTALYYASAAITVECVTHCTVALCFAPCYLRWTIASHKIDLGKDIVDLLKQKGFNFFYNIDRKATAEKSTATLSHNHPRNFDVQMTPKVKIPPAKLQ